MTTAELSRATGVPEPTIRRWVADGFLRPACAAYGTGGRIEWDDTAIPVARALRDLISPGAVVVNVTLEVGDVRSSPEDMKLREKS